ncbi:DUF6114 domain-containing protein [Natronorubrum sp. FCH18a]|uniref:DUF6114 domain-containing protein n=1 Tax=Natronorubrum sp. FCH18a TaxID=3447018 RepID=UPI003F51336F
MATQNGQDDSGHLPDGLERRWDRATEWTGSRWSRFNGWRSQRPFLGGVLLCLAGILITWVPMQILPDLIFIGGRMAGLLAIGAMFGVFVFVSGVFALTKPEHSDMIGVVGVVLSIFSLFGSLGGLFLGMLLGILGGNLCLAWKPDDEAADEGVSEPSRVDKASARVRESVQHLVGKSIVRLREGVDTVNRSGTDENTGETTSSSDGS